MKTNGIGHTIKKKQALSVRKVNIDLQVKKLEKDKVDFYDTLFTDGVVVSKKSMSKYVLNCYANSVPLEDGIHCDLRYMYYLDQLNNTCVLFTDVYSDHNDDNETKLDMENYIVVEIYVSPECFMVSSLANYYQDNYVDDDDTFDWDNNYFGTSSAAYNKISIVKAVHTLLNETQILRKKLIDSIVKS
ncbi:hypothetical protein QO200_17075 [Flavobacterium sp. Arc3]|uniref:hypothetical protein n=1 Tax=Flavobacterium sp. Arc3 TaxID=3046686 RepID=UPI00352C60BB